MHLARELKKVIEHKGDGNTNCNLCTQNGTQRLGKGSERGGNQKICREYPNNCITEIGQNTEKSPGNLWKLAATQTRVKDHHLTLVRKTCNE